MLQVILAVNKKYVFIKLVYFKRVAIKAEDFDIGAGRPVYIYPPVLYLLISQSSPVQPLVQVQVCKVESHKECPGHGSSAHHPKPARARTKTKIMKL